MTADTIKVGLPAEDDYDAVYTALGKAEGKVEKLLFKLQPIVEALKCGDAPPCDFPTLEDVGRLYDCLDRVEVDVGILTRHAREIQAALQAVNHARIVWPLEAA